MACLGNVLATLKAEVGFGIKGCFSRLSGLSLPLHDDSVWHSASSLAVHLETSVGMFPSPAHRRKIGKSRRSFRTSRVQIMN
uniref:hypothetical protein n=1 Tax=Klebsiella pneumoniae TaxID=573 RepID=UPI00312B42FC